MAARSKYRETTLRDLVIKADPDWVKTRRWHLEYDWTDVGGGKSEANYDERGAYTEPEVGD